MAAQEVLKLWWLPLEVSRINFARLRSIKNITKPLCRLYNDFMT